MDRRKITFLISRKSLFILILILALGAFLRLYKFMETFHFGADAAYAYLLAKRIIEDKYVLLLGPITSLHGVNILAPTYYYIITLLYFIFRGNEVLVTLSFTLAGISSLYIIYLVGKELFNAKTGLLASLLMAVSYEMVKYSRNIWEPHLIPFFILLSMYLLIISFKKQSIFHLLTSIFFFFISLMYISSFVLIPAIFLTSIYILKNIQKVSLLKSAAIITIIFFLLSLIFYLPVLIYETQHNFPSLTKLASLLISGSAYTKFNLDTVTFSFGNNISLLLNSLLLEKVNIWYILIAFGIIFVILGKNIFHESKIHIIAITLFVSFTLLSLYQGKSFTHRLSAVYPLIFLLTAYMIHRAESFHIRWMKLLISLGIFVIIIQYIYLNIKPISNLVNETGAKHVNSQLETAKFILNSSKGESFSIYVINSWDKQNFALTTYAYLLEKITGKKYAKIRDDINWVEKELDLNVDNIFLICEQSNLYNVKDYCLDYFRQKYELGIPILATASDYIRIYRFNESHN